MSNESLGFEELEIGREWVTKPRTVVTENVHTFADLTGDRNPVHLDPEFARSTPFRRCIAPRTARTNTDEKMTDCYGARRAGYGGKQIDRRAERVTQYV